MNAALLSSWTAALFLAAALFSHTVALRLVLLVLGTGCVIATLVRRPPSVGFLPPLWFPYALWAGWAVLSVAWSVNPEGSVKEVRNEILYCGLAFWLCYVGAQARNSVMVIQAVLALAVVGVCALALFHFGQGFVAYSAGWHGGAGNLSSMVLTLMPCVVLAAAYGHKVGWSRRRLSLAWMLIGLLFVAAYTSLNRTVWLAFALQFVVIALMTGPRFGIAEDVRARVATACAAFAFIIAGTAMTVHVGEERLAMGNVPFWQDPRLSIWPEVVNRVADQPVLGYGFGRGLLSHELRSTLQIDVAWHSHNLFLDTLLQLGAPGLVLLLLLVGSTLWRGWQLSRRADRAAAACGIALIAVVVGMLVRNMTDVLWVRQNALLYWGVIGVLLAWGRARARA